jgi:hypothetical protein
LERTEAQIPFTQIQKFTGDLAKDFSEHAGRSPERLIELCACREQEAQFFPKSCPREWSPTLSKSGLPAVYFAHSGVVGD